MKRKLISLLLTMSLLVCFCTVPAHAANQPNFTDVPPQHWAYSYIMRAKALGIMNGMSDGSFHPDETLTHAQVAQILYNMCPDGRSSTQAQLFVTPNNVRDVQAGSWYYYPVGWLYYQMSKCSNYGFIDPYHPDDTYNLKFRPDEPARRDYVANVIRILCGNYGYEFYDDYSARYYTDYRSMSAFTRYSVSFVTDYELFSGYPDGSFSGEQVITRAQAAKIFTAFYDNLLSSVYWDNYYYDYLYIDGNLTHLYRTDTATLKTYYDSASYATIYKDRFVNGSRYNDAIASLTDLRVGDIFTVCQDGVITHYQIACRAYYLRSDLIRRNGNYTYIANELFRARYDDTRYDLAFRVYAGDNLDNGDDADERLLIFADIIP